MKGTEIIVDGKRAGFVRTFEAERLVSFCDGKCDKAFGTMERPKVHLSPTEYDDYAFLADDEVGIAPRSGVWDGGQGKPIDGENPEQNWLNKWCIRSCERYQEAKIGEPIDLSINILAERACNMRSTYPVGAPTYPEPE